VVLLRSYNLAHWSHRSAIRVHTVLFSRLRVNLAMTSHSAANRRNFSAGSSMSCYSPCSVFCLERRTRTPSKGSKSDRNFEGLNHSRYLNHAGPPPPPGSLRRSELSALPARPAYNWPYRRSTSRQLFPTRKLWATSVALHRIRLLQVMPALRSQNRSAAGRQGARSCMSMAAARVVERPRKRQMAMRIFMPRRAPPFWPTNPAGN
jgi:hypothetical protein